jgi:protease-4
MKFFKIVFATMLGIILFNVLLIFVFFPLLASVGGEEKSTKVQANSILNLTLRGVVAEQANEVPFEIPAGVPIQSGEEKIGLQQLIKTIKHAATDNKIKGIFLNAESMDANIASMMQIIEALEDFKKSKKFVVAYGSRLGEGTLLLHKVADKSFLNPVGSVEFNGMGGELMFFAGALEKLGIQPMIFYAGNFKSATEPFRLKAMSPENKLQMQELIGDFYGNYLQKMQQFSTVPKDSLKALADNLAIIDPKDALNNKLVDGLKYEEEVNNFLKEKMGYKLDENITSISYLDYKNTLSPEAIKGKKIAVLTAEGEIIDGKGEDGTVSEKVYVDMLRKIKKDNDIKALVVRINSPGGSAYASEQIWFELNEIKKRIPIIASMGDVAASGGYYIATPANKIFANANTITGSIGVFGMMFNIEKAANDKLGVTFDRVGSGPYADFGTATRAWDERENLAMTTGVMNTYSLFKKRVSDSRKLTMEQVEAVAQGRVWTGQDAKQNGLVDAIGDLEEAIAEAKKLAKLENVSIENYPKEKSFMEKIVTSFGKSEELALIKSVLGDNYYLIQLLKNKNEATYQMRLPYSIRID